nr:MAG TPA: hypothetical protein [Caudoviricetes sp.]
MVLYWCYFLYNVGYHPLVNSSLYISAVFLIKFIFFISIAKFDFILLICIIYHAVNLAKYDT